MGREFLVPISDDDRRQLEIARAKLLEDRERTHTRVAMFDQEDVEGLPVRASQIERSVDLGHRARNFDRCAGSAKTLARQRGVADVQELDTTARGSMSAVGSHIDHCRISVDRKRVQSREGLCTS